MNTTRPLYISTGKVADGEKRYFPRKEIERKIWTKLKQGENLLLAAPRRTGKSSILKHIEKNPEPGFIVKYKAVQSIDSTNEFFKSLYLLLLEDDKVFYHYQRYLKKAAGALKKIVSRIRTIKVDGIEISQDTRIDYRHEFTTLLNMLPRDLGTIILLVDEFPDAVKNISIDKKQGIHFLQINRELRQGDFKAGIQFVYTGSIGLGNVVNRLGRPDLINDIKNVKVSPLTRQQGHEFIQCLLLGFEALDLPIPINEKAIDYILSRDSWRIPYYIQIIMDELSELHQESDHPIHNETVDQIIHKIITDRYTYQDYFENWKTRLKQALEKDEYYFALKVLNHISVQGFMSIDELHDLAVAHRIDDFKAVVNILEYDGYISRDAGTQYRFNSIILKEWWYINVAT